MPHLPDDDGYEPPLKVLRKRFNGVYREDHGLSGPTRRYLLMVVMLVALASLPTLAVITAGTSEIADNGRNRALDEPFLPTPMAGPVRPSPTTPQRRSRYDEPSRPLFEPGATPIRTPGVSPPEGTSADVSIISGRPPAPDGRFSPGVARSRPRSDVDSRSRPADQGKSRPGSITVFPTVPGLPAVPDDDWDVPLARKVPVVRDPGAEKPIGQNDSLSDKTGFSDGADSSGDPSSRSDDSDSADQDDSEDPDQDDLAHHECEVALRSIISDRPRGWSRFSGGQS
ncbi:hypothetical protein SAMN06264365_12354 [Actinoplanes regularis]|uniref:Uncharacterized protein n=2 Tax=Actinoplanes regularis TaxID=52697 RepID=A0A239H506_9ACTN|nr:hypothetical protein Are01nite_82060 [Actinoplanes regularis]SNS76225.1 hypothetical protein SAMN06264365_12354 [Actinoplanes regularis]